MDPQIEKTKNLKREKVLVRDRLAGFRTDLANRRTFLSYFRTALAFVCGGIAIIKFSNDPALIVVGFLCIPGGAFVLVQGIILYMKMKKIIQQEEEICDLEIE